MIQEELTKLADEAEDNEDDEDEKETEKEEHPKPTVKKVKVWLVRDGMDLYSASFSVDFLNYAFAIAAVSSSLVPVLMLVMKTMSIGISVYL